MSIPCSKCDNQKYQEYISSHGTKLARKMALYRMLLRLCEKKGYIVGEFKKDDKGVGQHKCHSYMIRLSEDGDTLTGIFDLFEVLLTQYILFFHII